jgi:hypothetical protein
VPLPVSTFGWWDYFAYQCVELIEEIAVFFVDEHTLDNFFVTVILRLERVADSRDSGGGELEGVGDGSLWGNFSATYRQYKGV